MENVEMHSGESSQQAALAAAVVSGCQCERRLLLTPKVGDCSFRALSSQSFFLSIAKKKERKKKNTVSTQKHKRHLPNRQI